MQRLKLSQPLLLVYICYIALGIATRYGGWVFHLDASLFMEVSRSILRGDLAIYSLRLGQEGFPYLAAPPLLALVISPFVALGDFLRLENGLTVTLVGFPLLVFDVLAIHQLVSISGDFNVYLEEQKKIFFVIVTLFSTGLFFSSVFMSHQESITLFFLLLGFRWLARERVVQSAIPFGLAILSKQTALFAIFPTLLFLTKSHFKERIYHVIAFLTIMSGLFTVVILPFVISDLGIAWDALFGYQTRIRLRHETIWKVVDLGLLRVTPGEVYSVVHGFLMNHANTVLLAVAVGVSILAVMRLSANVKLHRIVGVAALVSYLPLLLGKTVSTHYYTVPLNLIVFWDFLRNPRDLPYLSLGIATWIRAASSAEWSYPAGTLLLFTNVLVIWLLARNNFRKEE